MRVKPYFLGIVFFFLCCQKENKDIVSGEKYYLQNNSNHDVIVECFENNEIVYEAKMEPGESSHINTRTGGSNDVSNKVLFRYKDSVRAIFDNEKIITSKTVEFEIMDAEVDIYIPTDCRYRNKQKGCTRTFHITEEHYMMADSL